MIRGASWGWVALAFVLAQLPVVAEAWALTGTVPGQLPFGRCVALETSNNFTALVGGDAAVFAVRVRFFQRQGYGLEMAVSSGAIATAASWAAKGLLFIISIGFAAGSFHVPRVRAGARRRCGSWSAWCSRQGSLFALITLVLQLRRRSPAAGLRPHLVTIWANVKTIATEPRKIFERRGRSC